MNEEKRLTRLCPEAGGLVCRRDEYEKAHIEGYAIVFNSDSRVLTDWREDEAFIERIAPEAVTEDVLSASDIVLTVDHDFRRMLGRRRYGSGSLTARIDEKGVWFSCEAAGDELARSVVAHIERGDLFGCSFMFSMNFANCTYERNADDMLVRTIRKIDRVYDFSVVMNPAYPETVADVSERAWFERAGVLRPERKPVASGYYAALEAELKRRY